VSLKKKHAESGNRSQTVTETVINVTRDGDWLPPQELRAIALSAAGTEGDLTVSLQAVDHLGDHAASYQQPCKAKKNSKQQNPPLLLLPSSFRQVHSNDKREARELDLARSGLDPVGRHAIVVQSVCRKLERLRLYIQRARIGTGG
jgi:hypothetical protein